MTRGKKEALEAYSGVCMPQQHRVLRFVGSQRDSRAFIPYAYSSIRMSDTLATPWRSAEDMRNAHRYSYCIGLWAREFGILHANFDFCTLPARCPPYRSHPTPVALVPPDHPRGSQRAGKALNSCKLRWLAISVRSLARLVAPKTRVDQKKHTHTPLKENGRQKGRNKKVRRQPEAKLVTQI